MKKKRILPTVMRTAQIRLTKTQQKKIIPTRAETRKILRKTAVLLKIRIKKIQILLVIRMVRIQMARTNRTRNPR